MARSAPGQTADPPPKEKPHAAQDRGGFGQEQSPSYGRRMTVREMAAAADVSVGFMHAFLTVYERGVPELYALMTAEKIACHRAARIATLPSDEQLRLVAEITAGRTVKVGRSTLNDGGYSRLVKAWNAATEEARDRLLDAILATAEAA